MDTYTLEPIIIEHENGTTARVVLAKTEHTLAALQDMIAVVIENQPQAASYRFTINHIIHMQEEPVQ